MYDDDDNNDNNNNDNDNNDNDNIKHTIKSTFKEAPITGLDTNADEPDENSIKGRMRRRTMTKIKLNPHMSFSEKGRGLL